MSLPPNFQVINFSVILIMVIFLAKLKTDNIQKIIDFNKGSFAARKIMGLLAVRAYKDTETEDEYYAIAYWSSLDRIKRFLVEETLEKILGDSLVWFKVLNRLEGSNIGEIPQEIVVDESNITK